MLGGEVRFALRDALHLGRDDAELVAEVHEMRVAVRARQAEIAARPEVVVAGREQHLGEARAQLEQAPQVKF